VDLQRPYGRRVLRDEGLDLLLVVGGEGAGLQLEGDLVLGEALLQQDVPRRALQPQHRGSLDDERAVLPPGADVVLPDAHAREHRPPRRALPSIIEPHSGRFQMESGALMTEPGGISV